MDLLTARKKAAETLPVLPLTRTANAFTEVGRREGEGKGFLEQLGEMTPAGFPLPSLILVGLTQLLGLSAYGPEEKLRWGVAFEFSGGAFAFEFRKFGLRLLCEEGNLDSPMLRELVGRTRGLTDVVENYLTSELVPAQIANGSVTVPNLHFQLTERYRFLRNEAENAYRRPPPKPEIEKSEHGTTTTHDFDRPTREGGALATAAVDAYFSRLEHVFVLAAAFYPAALSGGLHALLSAGWSERAKAVLDLGDRVTKGLYDRLVDIREDWRNPVAHGGFHVGNASLYFHLPGIGALPARLRRTPAGVKVGFRLGVESFDSICRTFDEFDEHLSTGPLRFGLLWAESGLDVAFDAASLAKYRAATSSEQRFAALVEGESRLHDMHANMDY